jgi:hypothetical protein
MLVFKFDELSLTLFFAFFLLQTVFVKPLAERERPRLRVGMSIFSRGMRSAEKLALGSGSLSGQAPIDASCGVDPRFDIFLLLAVPRTLSFL